ncbi:MAG: transglycosylase domain-containing protein, partial [bacterium]
MAYGAKIKRKNKYVETARGYIKDLADLGSWRVLTRKERLIRLATTLATLGTVGVIAGFIFLSLAVAAFSKDLPTPDKLVTRDISVSTKILDRNGKTLYDIYGDENRQLVKLAELPEHVRSATLAIEDNEFYKHHGFDVKGMVYATFKIVVTGSLRSGSTITQQLIKNALLSSEQTITRKVKELVLAVQIESGTRYTKDDILQMYLNEVPYGGQALGIEAGSQMYFGKPARELTLAEAALMAGLPQAPSLYSPFGAYPENAKSRQEQVLKLMHERGWFGSDGQWHKISDEEYEQAQNEELTYVAQGQDIKAPHFVMFVRNLLTERYGEEKVLRGGLTVTTSLDLDLQEKAQEIVAERVEADKDLLVGNGALIAMDPKTGQILTMVGSKDYFNTEDDGNVNVVTALRQPGSSIKPVNYVTGIKQGYTAATLFMDVPTQFSGGAGQPAYAPVNYDGKFRGPILMRQALANSINVAAVKMLKLVGVQNMIDTAHDMGITSLNEPDRYGLALTLGGGEVKLLDMAVVFSTFASGGLRRDSVAILKVEDSTGKVLEEWKDTGGRRVLREEEAYIISSILSDNYARAAEFGLGSPLYVPGYTVAAKTGTTDDKRDNWTLGYTPALTVGVWVGNNDNSPMHPRLASGITGAAPIWHDFFVVALADKPKEEFKMPSGIVAVEISKRSGKIPQEGEDRATEYFIRGTEPTTGSTLGEYMDVCKQDGKLATDHCRRFGEVQTAWHEYYEAELPEWQEFVDKWVEEVLGRPNGAAPDSYSKAYLNPNGRDEPIINLKWPPRDATVSDNFTVEVEAFSPYKITTAEFRFDGELKATDSGGSTAETLKGTISTSKTGSYQVEVKVKDENGATGTLSFNVKIPTSNSAPNAKNDSYTASKNTALTKTAALGVLINDTDADGDSLTVSASSSTSTQGGTVSVSANGAFTYTPPTGYTGTDTFSYTASD